LPLLLLLIEAQSVVFAQSNPQPVRLDPTLDISVPTPMRLEVQYGESVEEAISSPCLGANEIYVPPYATVYGSH
jgi:hypothetical protein